MQNIDMQNKKCLAIQQCQAFFVRALIAGRVFVGAGWVFAAILFMIDSAQANSCRSLFKLPPILGSDPLEGESLVNYAIKDPFPLTKANPEVWAAYTQDPRYGDRSPLDYVLFDAMYTVELRNPSLQKHNMSFSLFSVAKWRQSGGVTSFRFLPTWDRFDMQQINRLISHGIYPLTLEPKTTEAWDFNGEPMNRIENLGVEISRAEDLELALDTQYLGGHSQVKIELFSKVFLGYDNIVAALNLNQRILFDTAYYLVYYGSSTLRIMMDRLQLYGSELVGAPKTQISEAEIQKLYREVGKVYALNFEFNTSAYFWKQPLRVTFLDHYHDQDQPKDKSYTLVDRFLNPADLAHLLPADVQAKIGQNPTEARKRVTDFLSDSFSIFFSLHYAETTKTLKKNLTLSKLLRNLQASDAYQGILRLLQERSMSPVKNFNLQELDFFLDKEVQIEWPELFVDSRTKQPYFRSRLMMQLRKDADTFRAYPDLYKLQLSRDKKIEICLALFEGVRPEEMVAHAQANIDVYFKQAQQGALSIDRKQPMLDFHKSFADGDFHLEINIEKVSVAIVPGKSFSGRAEYIMYPKTHP